MRQREIQTTVSVRCVMGLQHCIDGREVSASMKASIFLIFAALLGACSTIAPGRDGMQGDVDQAVAIIERFDAIPEKAIPPAVMRAARGVAILTVTKVGFIGSVRGGTGVVVARTDKGWSGPSAIGTGGIGAGLQAGAEVSELVVVLNTPAAVDAFAKGGNVTLSAALGAAAGDVQPRPASPRRRRCILTAAARAFSPASPWKVRESPPGTRPMRNITVTRSRRKKFSRARYSHRKVRRSCSRFYRSTEPSQSFSSSHTPEILRSEK